MLYTVPLAAVIALVNGVSYQPEQVHLSFGNNVGEIVITWSTFNNTNMSIAEYGIGEMTLSSIGSSTKFLSGPYQNHLQFLHRVVLKNLKPNSIYVYRCGSDLGWSSQFWFKSLSTESDWSPQLVIYGDLGLDNAISLPRLKNDTHMGMYDAVLHVGDIAYNLDWYDGKTGNEFMRKIEPIAAHLPYMTSPGNHEECNNFSNYRQRFSMPGGSQSIMYSFDIGPLHIISISNEVYYYLNYGLKQLVVQYEWLENDLIKANLRENREKRPWIIVMAHRPMYCSTSDGDDCNHNDTMARTGIPFLHFFGLEKLLYDYGVDVEIWAHEHVYERMWPIYNYTVYNGSYEAPYTNPRAPVHFITGSAGCNEEVDGFLKVRPFWSAFHSSDYGYTRLKAYNKTHLHFQQVSDNKNGTIIDSFWVIKDFHGPYQHSDVDFSKFNAVQAKHFV